MSEEQHMIGRVTRCSTRGFVGAVRLPEPELPVFGGYCLAEAQSGASHVVGLIYDISVEDDEFARQIATTDSAAPEQIADARQNRLVPVEFSALAVGYRRQDNFYYSLPPQPPLSLAPVHRMPPEDVRAFTSSWDYLPLVLSARQVPVDELLVAALTEAANERQDSERRRFLIEGGRACARLLGEDMVRVSNLLNSLRSAA